MNWLTGVTCAVVGAALGVAGVFLVQEMRGYPRLMPAAHAVAYEKWCGGELSGTVHYNAQRHITGCTAPGKVK